MTTSRSETKKIMVTGGRTYTNKDLVWRAMDRQLGEQPLLVLHGDAPGADALVEAWINARKAEGHPVEGKKFLAKWGQYGPAGGPIRNKLMVSEGPEVCIAFPGNRGTANAKNLARAAGIPVEEFR